MYLPAPRPSLIRFLLRDRLLLIAFAICALLIGYQVGVTLFHPAWADQATDWRRATLAWPRLLLVAWISMQLSRKRHPAAVSWWMWSVGFLFFALAQTIWTVYDELIFHHSMPFPGVPDIFYAVQYPFFILGVILLPRARFWGSRLILVLDDLLVIVATTALAWQFILAPIYAASGLPPLARAVSLAYPIGDLFLLFALTATLRRPDRFSVDRPVLKLLVLGIICLIIGDTWAAWLMVPLPHTFAAAGPPDLFWFAAHLVIPLAALCQFRLAQHAPPWTGELATEQPERRSRQSNNFTASLRLFFPIVIALLASGAIMVNATMMTAQDGWSGQIVSLAIGLGLLLLIVVRQEVLFFEVVYLRREAEYARVNEQAMRELNRRKDEFLGIVSHELRTPLTSLQGYFELLSKRFGACNPRVEDVDELACNIATARTVIQYSEESLQRIAQLVDDLLDDARIRDGRLVFYLEPCDLGVIVCRVVEEQRLLAPGRAILLELPAPPHVLVKAEAGRIAQVVTNYVANALKYSKEDLPVEVRLEVQGDQARVSVCDEGIGVPTAQQPHVWERFHAVDGNNVQSGSGVSLGLGLYISKNIIDGHHGQVGVNSAPGQGTVFWFTLPLAFRAT